MDDRHAADMLIDLRSLTLFGRPPVRWLARPIEKLLCLDRLNALYAGAKKSSTTVDGFLAGLLQRLDVGTVVQERDLARIPRTGPVVVVANHPFGGIEGLLLPQILRSIRPDVRIMANYLLARVQPMRDLFFLVDPFATGDSARFNVKGLKQSLAWLKEGGLLVVFPAGEVASFDPRQQKVVEPPWHSTVARLIRHRKCQVVPIFLSGHNSALFHLAGLAHPRLRTALLARELFQKRGKKVSVRIGRPISSLALNALGDLPAVTAYMRMRTFMLENCPARAKLGAMGDVAATNDPDLKPIVPPEPQSAMVTEIASLDDDCRLVDADDFLVCVSPAERMPHIMREIGRLRELTFRATGEGTGNPIDLDEFDSHYLHLFVWHKPKQEIVGAYRMGQADTILASHGKHGLYTSTLFDYGTHLLEQLAPALEIGRSFVRREYQRSYLPLFLLWKGIGQYVLRNPRYRVLFGPVSISSDYQTISRQVMVEFLKQNKYAPDLAKLVKPKVPLRPMKIKNWELGGRIVKDIEGVSDLVADLETELRGVPILLKQYLKMGGKILGFNIDPTFRDVLDALVMVDLTVTDRRIMEKYIGKDGMTTFLSHHAAAV